MSTDHLGFALHEIADDAEHGATQPAGGALWTAGRRRRTSRLLASSLAAACVIALLGVLVWPSGTPQASVPAVGVDGSTHLTTYPARISKAPFIEQSSRPGVTAAVVDERGDARTLFAVSPSGGVTRLSLPPDGFRTSPPSLSPDGRWLALDMGLMDLVSGNRLPAADVADQLRAQRLPVEEAAWWSPDSSRAFIASVNQGAPTSLGVVLGTDGTVLDVPFVAGESDAAVAGWLDDQSILAFVSMGPGTSRLEGRTWRVGDRAWEVSRPDLEWKNDLTGWPVRIGLSPNRSRLFVTTPLTSTDSGRLDRTASMLVDAGTGALLGLPDAEGKLHPDTDGATSGDWEGWGCRPAWMGERPVKTDGFVRWAPGEFGEDLVSVSSRYGSACVTFAGDELRGTAVVNGRALWQERVWLWGGRGLVLLAVGGAVWWFTRGRAWRERAGSPHTSQPYVPQR